MTKSSHFLPINISYSTEDHSKLYLREMVKLHGMNYSIISDHGTQFTFKCWMSFLMGLGTMDKLITTFHPQIDRQAERTTQNLEDMLRACVIDFNGIWGYHLPLIEFLTIIIITQLLSWLHFWPYMVGGVGLI